jgi:fatty acid desaturase
MSESIWKDDHAAIEALKPHLPRLYGRDWHNPLERILVSVASFAGPLAAVTWLDIDVLWPIAWLASGFVLAGHFNAMHYCSHDTFMPTKRANRFFGVLWALPIFMNFSLYRFFHRDHHRYTAVNGDPEPVGEIRGIWGYLKSMTNLDFVVPFFRMSLQSLTGRVPAFVRTRLELRDVQIDAVVLSAWTAAVAVCVSLSLETAVLYYGAPLLVAYAFNFCMALTEHYGCALTANTFASTRTMTIRSRLLRYYYWNSNFHVEHHLLPGVASWHLPELHGLIKHALVHKEESYLRFQFRVLKDLLWSKRRVPEPVDGRCYDFNYPLYRP